MSDHEAQVPDGDADLPPPPDVTLELFRAWRAPRLGAANPEIMTNPVWAWLVRSRITAFSAADVFKEPSALDHGPGWCFSRFGQTSTELPDGRVVWVAGEHEDHYDPDFFIYNDVVVRHPNGRLDIYGYPPADFPPTDFHSATLVGDRILLIGNLSYAPARRPGTTPVFVLNVEDFSISEVKTVGSPPGWIHRHTAVLNEAGDAIRLTGGLVSVEGGSSVENSDDWELRLADFSWRCVVKRNWVRRELRRADGQFNHLWEIRMFPTLRYLHDDPEKLREVTEELVQKVGAKPDMEILAHLFKPSMPHEAVPEEEGDYGVVKVWIDGVLVRYNEEMKSVRITVEGELPAAVVDALSEELRAKLSALENSPWVQV